MLEMYLEKLNAAVVAHNAKIDELIELTLLTEDEGRAKKWTRPVTRETVAEVSRSSEWPAELLNIVGALYVPMHAKKIFAQAKSVPHPTQITRDLCKGAASSKGMSVEDWEHPLHLKLIDAAHLAARSEKKQPAGV